VVNGEKMIIGTPLMKQDFQWKSGLPKKDGYYLVWHNERVTRYWYEEGFWYEDKPWVLDNNGIDFWAEIPAAPSSNG